MKPTTLFHCLTGETTLSINDSLVGDALSLSISQDVIIYLDQEQTKELIKSLRAILKDMKLRYNDKIIPFCFDAHPGTPIPSYWKWKITMYYFPSRKIGLYRGYSPDGKRCLLLNLWPFSVEWKQP